MTNVFFAPLLLAATQELSGPQIVFGLVLAFSLGFVTALKCCCDNKAPPPSESTPTR